MTTSTLAYPSINLPRVNWKIYCLCGFSMILCLSVFYVFSINNMTNGTYLIKDYQKQIDKLLVENKTLEQGFARTSFMGTIGEKTQEMSFQKVKEVKYIQILEASAFLPKTGKNNN